MANTLTQLISNSTDSHIIYGCGDIQRVLLPSFEKEKKKMFTDHFDLSTTTESELLDALKDLYYSHVRKTPNTLKTNVYGMEIIKREAESRIIDTLPLIYPFEKISDFSEHIKTQLFSLLNKIKFVGIIQNIKTYEEGLFQLNYAFLHFYFYDALDISFSQRKTTGKTVMGRKSDYTKDPSTLKNTFVCLALMHRRILRYLVDKTVAGKFDMDVGKFELKKTFLALKRKMIVSRTDDLVQALKEMKDQRLLRMDPGVKWFNLAFSKEFVGKEFSNILNEVEGGGK